MTRNILFFIGLSVICVSILRIFIVDIAAVNGTSMEPLLHSGDLIFINKAAYGLSLPFSSSYLFRWGAPVAGEIILYRDPLNKVKTVKRCIAVAGDPVLVKNDVLYINNYRIPLKFYQVGILEHESIVPENSIFVLGDNFDNSSDSRSTGFIPIDTVEGNALFLAEPVLQDEPSTKNRAPSFSPTPGIVWGNHFNSPAG
ncbi:MAG: signal peptidase I [Spirochaetales bacterium]|nr:signal peptidase I [Spirochaetales bacterium]